jgi:isoleucyl-tRNA synthetase
MISSRAGATVSSTTTLNPVRARPLRLPCRSSAASRSGTRTRIVDKLREVHALWHAEKYVHSYMHCWRHKTPIIYRATTQWFAGMDDVPGWHGVKPEKTLRETALAGIEATQFFPAWGKARLHGMIANRPD